MVIKHRIMVGYKIGEIMKLLVQCRCYGLCPPSNCKNHGYAIIEVKENDLLRKFKKPGSLYLPRDEYWDFGNANIDKVTFRHVILEANHKYWVFEFYVNPLPKMTCLDIDYVSDNFYPSITKYRYNELCLIWEKYDRDIAMLKDANLALTTENLHKLIKGLLGNTDENI